MYTLIARLADHNVHDDDEENNDDEHDEYEDEDDESLFVNFGSYFLC